MNEAQYRLRLADLTLVRSVCSGTTTGYSATKPSGDSWQAGQRKQRRHSAEITTVRLRSMPVPETELLTTSGFPRSTK